METLIYILKAHLLFLILGGIYYFVLRNEKNFAFNRFYLLAIYGVSIIAPLLEVKISKNVTFITPELFNNGETENVLSGSSEVLKSNLFNFETLIPWVYGIIISISLLTFIIRFIKSYQKFKLLHNFSKFDYRNKVYWVEENIPPFTFLNKTLLPESLKTEENKEMIIRHEEAHRKTLHFLDIIWVEILSSVLIFNPLNKKIKKYLVENHEFLADAYACEESQKSIYVQILIQQTLKQNQISFVSYFAKPTILNRLNMLDKNKKTRTKPFLVAISLAIISIVFSCDLNPEEEVILKGENKEIMINDDAESSDKVDENTVFSIVEDQAEPNEGITEFYNFINDYLEGKYPQEALNKGAQGVVYLQFIIEKDGSLSNIQPVKGIGYGCDELAVSALRNSPNWIPGKQKGKVVRSQRVIPIRFKID